MALLPRRLRALTVLTALGLAAVLTGAAPLSPATASRAATAVPATSSTGAPLTVVGYLAFWDQVRGLGSVQRHPELTDASPSWWRPTADGSIVRQTATVDDSAATVQKMQAAGVRVLPAIANYDGRSWSRTAVGAALADPTARSRMVRRIVDRVVNRGLEGIDIDFEHLAASDRAGMSAFARELSTALHAKGKLLAITVHPKSSEPGGQPKNQAQDYAALGAAADQFRVMLYDYHWDTSAPGPVAPIAWVKQVATFTASVVPRNKIVLGFAGYGYDWPATGAGETQMWTELTALAREHGAPVVFDPVKGGSSFRYVDDAGTAHTVWMEDAASLAQKTAVVRSMGLAGMHLWRLGGEDPALWAAVR